MTDRPDDASGRSQEKSFRARSRPGGDVQPPKIDLTAQVVDDLRELNDDARLIVDRGRDHFLGDSGRLVRHAADGIIVKVHELCDRLPQEFKDARPDVPWDEIRGTRNRIGHNYRTTDYQIIWNTLAEDVPALIAALS